MLYQEIMTGINPKKHRPNKQFNEHAKRYIFYPLHNIDFSATQAVSPVWCRKVPKGRFVLLESLEYVSSVPSDNDASRHLNVETTLTMGTAAQLAFMMGNSGGTGFMSKGLVELTPLIDVDAETAKEVEAMLLPKDGKGKISIPDNLLDFRKAIEKVDIPKTQLGDLAKEVKKILLISIDTAIQYCKNLTAELEQELNAGKTGTMGIRSLSESNKYYFRQIKRPLPDEQPVNSIGDSLAAALATALQQKSGQNSAEMLSMKIELDTLRKQNDEYARMIEEFSESMLNENKDTEQEENEEHLEKQEQIKKK